MLGLLNLDCQIGTGKYYFHDTRVILNIIELCFKPKGVITNCHGYLGCQFAEEVGGDRH